MNRKTSLIAALVAGFIPVGALAQVSPTVPAPAAPAAPAAAPAGPSAPQAFPAKIALIAFQQAVIATNEGQRALQDVQKKYEPKKTEIDAAAAEVDSLKKQAEAGKATMSAEEYNARLKTIDSKEKKLNLDAEEASSAYNEDLQKAYSVVAGKVNQVLRAYVQNNGYTLLDVSNEQSAVMWASPSPNSDITEAVIVAYNASSGVAPPIPSAPSAAKPKPAAPAAPAAPKPAPKQ